MALHSAHRAVIFLILCAGCYEAVLISRGVNLCAPGCLPLPAGSGNGTTTFSGAPGATCYSISSTLSASALSVSSALWAASSPGAGPLLLPVLDLCNQAQDIWLVNGEGCVYELVGGTLACQHPLARQPSKPRKKSGLLSVCVDPHTGQYGCKTCCCGGGVFIGPSACLSALESRPGPP